MSWNRKYRPHKISQLHLQSVKNNLHTLFESGNIPQAFLFAGPKGTGKTSSSRIIGALLNEKKNAPAIAHTFIQKKPQKSSFFDPDTTNAFIKKILEGTSYVVQEMDAASNRGIDNIRELKERIALPPQEGNMTVYILDEAHMLTTEAFNALLKVLEEPPSHVVFILATTELHKIPDTIASRCHLVRFTKASIKEIVDALQKIVTAEKISAEATALHAIAAHADGSFRDAIKLLEVLTVDNSLTLAGVQDLLTTTNPTLFVDLVAAITSKDEKSVVTLFKTLRKHGVNEKYFHTQLVSLLHRTLIAHYGIGDAPLKITAPVALFLLKAFSDASLSEPNTLPLLKLELTALEIISRAKQKKVTKKTTTKAEMVQQTPTISLPVTPEVTHLTTPPTKKEIESLQKIESEIPTRQPLEVAVKSSASKGDPQKIMDRWHEFLDAVSKDHHTIGALLRSAQPLSVNDHILSIGVYYKFHQEQLSDNTFLAKIQDVVEEFAGGTINFAFKLVSPATTTQLTDPNSVQTSNAKDLAQLASESLM